MPNADERVVIEAYSITAGSTVRAALELMDGNRTHVLAVTDGESGRVEGIVLRQALERGCLRMGHDPGECLIAHHTLRDVVGVADLGARGSRRLAARRYQVLLDGAGYPVAILKFS